MSVPKRNATHSFNTVTRVKTEVGVRKVFLTLCGNTLASYAYHIGCVNAMITHGIFHQVDDIYVEFGPSVVIALFVLSQWDDILDESMFLDVSHLVAPFQSPQGHQENPNTAEKTVSLDDHFGSNRKNWASALQSLLLAEIDRWPELCDQLFSFDQHSLTGYVGINRNTCFASRAHLPSLHFFDSRGIFEPETNSMSMILLAALERWKETSESRKLTSKLAVASETKDSATDNVTIAGASSRSLGSDSTKRAIIVSEVEEDKADQVIAAEIASLASVLRQINNDSNAPKGFDGTSVFTAGLVYQHWYCVAYTPRYLECVQSAASNEHLISLFDTFAPSEHASGNTQNNQPAPSKNEINILIPFQSCRIPITHADRERELANYFDLELCDKLPVLGLPDYVERFINRGSEATMHVILRFLRTGYDYLPRVSRTNTWSVGDIERVRLKFRHEQQTSTRKHGTNGKHKTPGPTKTEPCVSPLTPLLRKPQTNRTPCAWLFDFFKSKRLVVDEKEAKNKKRGQ